MSQLNWVIHRLRAMSLTEVARRTRRRLAEIIEQRRVLSGWTPQCQSSVGPNDNLFDMPDEFPGNLDGDALDLLLQGRLEVLGAAVNAGNPPGWHRDPQTGIESDMLFGKRIDYRDPSLVGNVKLIWEIGRHQHLVPLAAAYARTGDTRYRNNVAEQIDSFIEANPYGIGIHWCSALEVSLRLIAWTAVHSLIALRDGRDGFFGLLDPKKLGDAIYHHAYFIRHFLSLDSSANNHLIGELAGLFVGTRVFNLGPDGSAWSALAHEELEKQARLQIHDDGVAKEQAFYYNLWVLEYLMFVQLAAQRFGQPFSPGFAERVQKTGRFLAAVTPQGGMPPQVGDADDGFVLRFNPAWPRDPYAEVRDAFDAVFLAKPPETQKGVWYSAISRPTAEAVNTGTSSGFFPQGGYAVIEAERAKLLFDAGPLGFLSIAAHGHADALSFCLAIDDHWWLVDPGTYAYHAEPAWRRYFRSTSAHNTICVDDEDQSLQTGPFMWARHARGRFVEPLLPDGTNQSVTGSHDGYKRLGIIHTRELGYLGAGRCFTITDRLSGRGDHDFQIAFHLAPDLEVSGQDARFVVSRDACTRLVIDVDPAWDWAIHHGCNDPIMGWFSPSLGRKMPCSTIVGRYSGSPPLEHISRLNIEFR